MARNTNNRPNFFIVGAPRCGTTALYTYLRRHPQVFMPEQKEPHFFNTDMPSASAVRDEAEYLNLFFDAVGKIRVGEGSVYYLSSRRAAFEIKRFSPEARIIVMLRNPVDVMYAVHYVNVVSWVENTESFPQALSLEEARKKGERLPPWLGAEAYKVFYRELVTFPQQVQRYFDVFGRENVHVIIYDDFNRDTAKAFRQTCSFLGVNPDIQLEFPVVWANTSFRSWALARFIRQPPEVLRRLSRIIVPRRIRGKVVNSLNAWNRVRVPRRPLPSELRNRLTAELAPQVHELSALLGRDLSDWSKVRDQSSSTAA